jgi:hypothetical protein
MKGTLFAVIASTAKQPRGCRAQNVISLGCFAALAPRNDGADGDPGKWRDRA